jgi:hypothetical protein
MQWSVAAYSLAGLAAKCRFTERQRADRVAIRSADRGEHLQKYIHAERQHIAADLVAALERLHELDLALASGRTSSAERDRLEAGRSSINAEVLRLSDLLHQLDASLSADD